MQIVTGFGPSTSAGTDAPAGRHRGTIAQHVEDVLESVTEPALWIGQQLRRTSDGGGDRTAPVLVERAILLDPALGYVAGSPSKSHGAMQEDGIRLQGGGLRARAAERTHPRRVRREEMLEHLVEPRTGGFFYRYSREVVAEAYRQMATAPPAWKSLRVPTLLVVAEHAKLVSAAEVELYRAALGPPPGRRRPRRAHRPLGRLRGDRRGDRLLPPGLEDPRPESARGQLDRQGGRLVAAVEDRVTPRRSRRRT